MSGCLRCGDELPEHRDGAFCSGECQDEYRRED